MTPEVGAGRSGQAWGFWGLCVGRARVTLRLVVWRGLWADGCGRPGWPGLHGAVSVLADEVQQSQAHRGGGREASQAPAVTQGQGQVSSKDVSLKCQRAQWPQEAR